MFEWLSSFINGNQETSTQTPNNDEMESDISFNEAIEYFQTLTIEEFEEQFEMHCSPCKGLLKNYGIVRCESKKFCSLIMNNKLTPSFKVDQLFDIVCFNLSGYERCLLYFTPKFESNNWSERKIEFMDLISTHFSTMIYKKKDITLDDVIADLNFKMNHSMDQRITNTNDHREQEPLYIMFNSASAMNLYINENLSKMIHMINLYKSKIENHIWESYTLIKVVPKVHHHTAVDVDGNGNVFNANNYLHHDELYLKNPNEVFFLINTAADGIEDSHYKKIIKPINSTGSFIRTFYVLRSPKDMLMQVLKKDFHDWFLYVQELLINKHLNIVENVARRPSYFKESSVRIHPDSNISDFVQVGYRLDLSNNCSSSDSLPSYEEILES
ncbi:hypothetical protein BN7_5188 [Wickerhamomyces ciferrii]|uniref:Uncharacterized protein n=1 Tax=Wickerhamomyces ciferrii (strain ATCC 14091 / BCRC 22168 / CBS 111 / JCM 3599 / NBRC 0793 / NRRL Y-1031 F-60-10) TaxID=1206466 RepID=K0KK27_WICCF|nr:uncharacterized protein BN7_5188 [Wickerhamomyces ciferrii]CCH45605.1 hypothetical protein BN7_5188 [Wickerhamomyces ciferrii]